MYHPANHTADVARLLRFPLLTLVACVAILVASRPAGAQAPSPIKLSAGAEAAAKSLATKPGEGPRVLLIDTSTATPEATVALLAAIDDFRRAKGEVFAVCPNSAAGIKDGAAIVAMACDGLAFIKGAELTGAEDSWCASASRRDDLVQKLALLGRIDELLARRFTEATDGLSWSQKSGYTADTVGSTKLAEAGKPLRLGAPQLKRVGITCSEHESVEAAIAAIAAASIKPRTKVSPGLPGPAGGAGGKTPSGGQPGMPAGGSATKPSTPSVPAKPTTTPPPAAVGQEKLAEKLAEYAKAMAELKGLLKEFNDYYTGVRGTWTSEHKGLKWVWEDGSEHTRDPDTKVICQRLQRDIKTKMGIMESCTKTVERIVKDRGNPEVVRMKAYMAAVEGLKIGIERNKVSNYETYYKQVMGLN